MRTLVQRKGGIAWGCSDCKWNFEVPPGPPVGRTLEEMKQHYLHIRDTAFRLHRCEEHPK